MDLSSPLRSLSPGLTSAVLQVLAGTESALSAVQIARLAHRGTRTGQRPVIDQLIEHGLVLAHPSNTGHLYQLNRQHVLAAAVLAALSARSEVLTRLAGSCGQLTPRPVHASVFGSFARGAGDSASDIDLLLVPAAGVDVDAPEWTGQLDALADAALAWTGNRLETVVLSETRLAQVAEDGEPLVATWSRDAITVLGQSPSDLLRRLTSFSSR